MLTNASDYRQRRFSFLFNINQEWSQVAGQTQITEALLITDSKESNFSSGGEKRRFGGLKKDEG